LAGRADDAGLRAKAVQGYVRLALDAENAPLKPNERVSVLKKVLPWARPEERWAVLAGLAQIPEQGSLELALSMLDEPATRAEAAQAATQIASALPATRREHSRAALEKIFAAVSDPDQKQAALAALRRIDPKAEPSPPVAFRRIRLDGAFRSEGVAVTAGSISPPETSSISGRIGNPSRCGPRPRNIIPRITARNSSVSPRTSIATAGWT
jgi:hypothetical protein